MAGKPANQKGDGRGIVWIQGLACGGFVAMAPAAALLIGALLAPAIVAWMLDRVPGRAVARAVFLCGAVPAVRPLLAFWNLNAADASTALALLSDPLVLVSAWGGAAFGWLMCETLPLGVRFYLDMAGSARSVLLRAERETLIRAWGLDSQ
jgi:hypothetical protein